MIEKEYLFSPSELDYKAKKCPRCFYIDRSEKYRISRLELDFQIMELI